MAEDPNGGLPPRLDIAEFRCIFRCANYDNCKNWVYFLSSDQPLIRCIKFHYLCATCTAKNYEYCPLDDCKLTLLPEKNFALTNLWNILKFRCILADQGCDAVVTVGEMRQHLREDCQFRHLLPCRHISDCRYAIRFPGNTDFEERRVVFFVGPVAEAEKASDA